MNTQRSLLGTAALLLSASLASAQSPAPATSPQAPAGAAPATAQTAPQTTGAAGTISVEARLVTLPVTVRDKKGKIVSGLTKDDFTLLEDTRPQTIKSLSVDTHLPLTLGLAIDTSESLRDALDQERAAGKTFFETMLTAPNDKAFLLHFDREVELLEDLTPSKDKLEFALADLGPTRASRTDTDSDPDSGTDSHSSARRSRGGTQLYDGVFLAADELMKKQPGRKALILFSDGADRGSRETLHEAIDAAERADTVVYAVYFKGEQHSDNPFTSPGGGRRGGMGGGYPGGGGGYPGGGGGYPGGGRGGGQRPNDEPHIDGKKIMQQIAGETGGRFYEAKKKENLAEIYADIAEELRSQYVLTYTPDSTTAGFHKITLTAKKKDLNVETRPGYYSH